MSVHSLQRLTFSKAEHLCSRKQIEQLFGGSGKAMSDFPLRIVYRFVPREERPVKVLMSVSKRHFKHAVDRNRVKRQLREAYRHAKAELLPLFDYPEADTEGLHIAFIWLSKEPAPTALIFQKVRRLLMRLREKHHNAR